MDSNLNNLENSVDQEKRDFLYIATGTMAMVGTGFVIWPLIDQMNPSADVLSQSAIEVDVSSMGQDRELQ